MWLNVVAIVLLAQGVGHSLGLFPAFGLASQDGQTALGF